MRPLLILGLIFSLAYSIPSQAQHLASDSLINPAMHEDSPESAKAEKAKSRILVPVINNAPNQVISLTVDGANQKRFPQALAGRILVEAVHAITHEVSGARSIAVHMNVLLKLGGNRNYVETVYGSKFDTVVVLKEWNEQFYSRLLARAVRNSMFTDKQLDELAHSAVQRAHTYVDVTELKGH